ncbi:MAG: sugar transferase [Eubacteriales bacterium]
MDKHLLKIDATLWSFIKYMLYISLMGTFVLVSGIHIAGYNNLSRTLGVTLITYAVSGVLFLKIYGSYDIGRRKSKPIIRSLILASICTDIVTYVQVAVMMTDVPDVKAFRFNHIGLLAVVMIIQTVLILVFTYGGHGLYFALHEPERCCIITASQKSLNAIVKGIDLYQKQYKIVDIVDYRDPELCTHILDVDTVFVYDVPSDISAVVMRECYKLRKNVYFNPLVEDIMKLHAEQYMLDDIYLLNKNSKVMTLSQRVVKRLMDVFFSVAGGILFMPLCIGAVIAIKIDDKGPILFKQKRATLDGAIIEVYKFRTMKVDAEIKSAMTKDERITRVGHVLRRTRIDEIPQLWNVFKGEMALVGPRPEMVKNVKNYTKKLPEFEYRLRMKGGLTGYAQIAGKYNTPPKDKLTMDMMYIEEFSIWKDIQLIFQTILVLIKMDSTEGFHTETQEYKYRFIEYRSEEKKGKKQHG